MKRLGLSVVLVTLGVTVLGALGGRTRSPLSA
jgi:hypothetical protein